MDLRQTETKLNQLIELYVNVRHSYTNIGFEQTEAFLSIQEDAISSQENCVPLSNNFTLSKEQIVESFKYIQSSLEDMDSKIERYKKRLSETDPITGNPRYGIQTSTRVAKLITNYDSLFTAMKVLKEYSCIELVEQSILQDKAEQQRIWEDQQRQDRIREEQMIMQKIEEEHKLQQQKHQQEELHRQEVLELRQRAEESRRRRLEVEASRELEHQQSERQWEESIVKGIEGVQLQLIKLCQSDGTTTTGTTTSNHTPASATTTKTTTTEDSIRIALQSLHTLFQQIVRHPEDSKFRRIRRDHEKFQKDIGRHAGGEEILIAAGFRLQTLEGKPCFVSTEPNLETDMDHWMEWFGLFKATLELLQQELESWK
jgi:PUB domain